MRNNKIKNLLPFPNLPWSAWALRTPYYEEGDYTIRLAGSLSLILISEAANPQTKENSPNNNKWMVRMERQDQDLKNQRIISELTDNPNK